jgi:heparan-alpha-glucosaminide N-acetyltransferase
MAKSRDTSPVAAKAARTERFPSLDALRGVFLLLFVSNGFGLRQMLNQEHWSWITNQWTPSAWTGCTLWDLLTPGMLFVVGAALPFSYANRLARGQRWPRQFLHALVRTGLLLAIGMYLDSYRENRLSFDLRGELQQIALAYFVAFLVLPMGMPVHGVVVVLLLLVHTAAHVIYALAGGYDLWTQGAQSLGLAVDQWLHFGPHPEKYVTLNLVPATTLVMLGMLTSDLVRGSLTPGHKVVVMTVTSFSCILLGWLLSGGNGWIDFSWPALIPMIKRIGTLTFLLTSFGWTLLLFTYFYTLMEGFSFRIWALPVTLVGCNSLLLYVTYQLFRDWAVRSAMLVLPVSRPQIAALQPLLVELIVVGIFWSLCLLLYLRRIYVKV